MSTEQASDLEKLYRTWPTTELVRATTIEKQDYNDQALDLVKQELARRGVTEEAKANLRRQFLREKETQHQAQAGIRGSLLFFVVMMGLGSALMAFLAWKHFIVEGTVQDSWDILALMLPCYGLLVFFLLIRKHYRAPRHARWFLITILIVTVSDATQGWNSAKDLSIYLYDQTKVILFLLFTLLWLKESPRIASTYGLVQEDEPKG